MCKNKILSLIFILSLSSFISCSWYEKREIESAGKEAIAKIEKFKKDKGRLPEIISEFDEGYSEGSIFYEKVSSTNYLVYAFLDDGFYTYNSETKIWELRPKWEKK